MKKSCFLIVSCLLLISTETGWAQNRNPIAFPSKQPVLIDDTHPESQKLAKEKLDRQHVSALSIINNLSERQKKSIIRIEAKRDKTLEQMDEKIAAKKERLTALKSSTHKDLKLIDKTTCEISKLAIERQKTKARAKKKIRSQLTISQRTVFDSIK